MSRFWPATALDGSADALTAIDGEHLGDGDAGFVVQDGIFSVYRLHADSGAESSPPDILAPAENAGNKRWIRVGFLGEDPPVPIDIDSADNWQIWAGYTHGHKNVNVGRVTNPLSWEIVAGAELIKVVGHVKPAIFNGDVYLLPRFNDSVTATSLTDLTAFTEALASADWSVRDPAYTAVIGDTLWFFGENRWRNIHKVLLSAMPSNTENVTTYPTEGETWLPDGNALPIGSGYGVLFIVGENIYIVGGVDEDFNDALHIMTAPVSDPTSWTIVPDKTLPDARYLPSFAAIGEYLYIYGGSDGNVTTFHNTILRAHVSDPTTWETVPGATLPQGRTDMTSFVTDTHVYLMGGQFGTSYLNVSDSIWRAPIEDPTNFTVMTEVFPAQIVSTTAPIIVDGQAWVLGHWGPDSASRKFVFRTTLP